MRSISALIRQHPALSLFTVAFVFGAAPLALVHTEVFPTSYSQLGALSASAAGFLLAYLEGGRNGLRELVRRVLIWRVGFAWWAVALFYTAIAAAGAVFLATLVDPEIVVDWGALPPVLDVVPMMLVLIVLAGLGEEFGWRGFLVPRLQRRHSALISSLIIGALHSLWHVPLFLVDGTAQSNWVEQVGLVTAFLGYSLFVVAWAVHLSWFFNNTNGSVLIAAVVHGAGNAWIGGYFDVAGLTGMVGNTALASLMAIMALVIVVAAGSKHLSRTTSRDVLGEGPSETTSSGGGP